MYKNIKTYTRSRCQVSVYRTTGPLVYRKCLLSDSKYFRFTICTSFCKATLSYTRNFNEGDHILTYWPTNKIKVVLYGSIYRKCLLSSTKKNCILYSRHVQVKESLPLGFFVVSAASLILLLLPVFLVSSSSSSVYGCIIKRSFYSVL